MKKYSIFHPWIMSFYSKSLYRDVAQNWKGLGFTYLLLLLIVCWIPLLFKINIVMHAGIEHTLMPIVEQLPTITIKDGKAGIDQPSPYMMHDTQGNLIAVIDTSGKYTNLKDTPAFLLLTSDTLYMKKESDSNTPPEKEEVFKYELSKVTQTTVIDKPIVKKYIHFAKTYFWLLLPALVLLTFIYRIIQMLVYALFGLLFTVILHTHLTYKTLLRLSAIAITPSLILSTFFTGFNIYFPYQLTVYFVVSMCYLFFGVVSNKSG